MRHIPVLLKETIEILSLKPGDKVIDCTLGDGGHAEIILDKIGPDGVLLGIDADPESLLRAKRYLYNFGERVMFARDNFANLKKIAEEKNFGPVNAIVADLGWSSQQFEERGRGFSFEKNEPLDMRYTPANGSTVTAAGILNQSSEEELSKIFKQYGEESLHREIAAEIVRRRAAEPVENTGQLSEAVLAVYRAKLGTEKEIPWIGGLHPATKVFQALRIAVNRELEVLKQALPQALDLLDKGGRLAVISFHSLEDRIVKHFFQSLSPSEFEIITKKPVIASEAENEHNRRSRSAKLRAIKKL